LLNEILLAHSISALLPGDTQYDGAKFDRDVFVEDAVALYIKPGIGPSLFKERLVKLLDSYLRSSLTLARLRRLLLMN